MPPYRPPEPAFRDARNRVRPCSRTAPTGPRKTRSQPTRSAVARFVPSSPLFSGLGSVAADKARFARPAAQRPQAEAVEVEIDHRRRIERQGLADQQAADDRNTERAAQLGAL